ncbi:MAG: serine protease [Acidobacteriota bacterium]
MDRALAFILIASCCFGQAAPAAPRLLRSLSGPSGKIVGAQYVLDETRNRFVYPQDRGLVIYFEWLAAPGDHALTAVWKDPTGKVVFISPDVRIQSEGPDLRSYWNYDLYPTSISGVWTLDVRIDGQPAGSHSFEVVVPASSAAPALSMNDIYRSASRSLVWVHKLDAQGRRTDVSTGFVIGQDRIATAFQAIDSTDGLEVEFEDGRVVKTDRIWACSRLEDWAVIQVATTTVPALVMDAASPPVIGDTPLVFNVEARMTRAFGGVDITGRRKDPVFGERIQIAPAMAAETAGGPVIATSGKVVAILGGNVVPGGRFDQRSSTTASPFWALMSIPGGAIPVALLREAPEATTLRELYEGGVLSEPIHPVGNFVSGRLSPTPKKGQDRTYLSVSEYSRRDSITVFTNWKKLDKEGKGGISGKVFDAQNRLLVNIPEKRVSLNGSEESRFQFGFSLATAPRGTYRVDVRWNSDTVWRTFVTIVD